MSRPVKTMRRHELIAEARRLGVKKPDLYLVNELRHVVTARLRKESGR